MLKEFTINVHQRGDHATVHTYHIRASTYHRTVTDSGSILYVLVVNEGRVDTVQAELIVSGQDTVLITQRSA